MISGAQYDETTWHYVDCNTGSIVAYVHGAIIEGGYGGGCYNVNQNRIYLTPGGAAAKPIWHYIQELGGTKGLCPHMFGSSILSSTS